MGTDTNSIDYNDVSFTISSDSRVAVLLSLEEGVATPSKIAEKTGIDISHTSRALNELRERDIVELIVDDETKKGRLYELSDSTSDEFIGKVREVSRE